MYKRLIAAIIIKDGIAVQSFGYKHYKPLGDPIALAQNYARWGSDELVVLDISATRENHEPRLDLIAHISEVTAGTPLIYGGGLRDVEQVSSVISAGADRLILDDCLLSETNKIKEISEFIGRQTDSCIANCLIIHLLVGVLMKNQIVSECRKSFFK